MSIRGRAGAVAIAAATLLFGRPTPVLAQAVLPCVYESPGPSTPNPGPIAPECSASRAMSVNIVSGGGTGGGASGTPGSSGTTAQYVQGVPGGFPIPISGSITATSTYPFTSTQGQATSGSQFVGVGGMYYSTTPTLTNAQFSPFSLDSSGWLNVHVQAGGGGSSATPTPYATNGSGQLVVQQANAIQPYGVASSAPIANSFVGISGYDGTNVRPVSIDPTTGAVLTKSAASVNGTYGAPNTTVTASANSVQYEQGTQANGYFGVNLGATPQPVSGTVAVTGAPTPIPTPAGGVYPISVRLLQSRTQVPRQFPRPSSISPRRTFSVQAPRRSARSRTPLSVLRVHFRQALTRSVPSR